MSAFLAALIVASVCLLPAGITAKAEEQSYQALVPKPMVPNAITPNPYLSPGDSVIHNDPYSSDVTGTVLPLGIMPTLTRASDQFNAASCPSSVLYDRYGSAITQLNGGLCIADLDTDGIPRAGSFTTSFKDPSQPKLGREYLLQTSYSMVDAEDHLIAPTSHGHHPGGCGEADGWQLCGIRRPNLQQHGRGYDSQSEGERALQPNEHRHGGSALPARHLRVSARWLCRIPATDRSGAGIPH